MQIGGGGTGYLLVRSPSSAVTLQAQIIDAPERGRTEVVLTKDGDNWRFDKMFMAGGGEGYQFLNLK